MARNCPACSTEMRTETIDDVQLDVCPQCAGVWFDPEELRTLLARDPLSLTKLEDWTGASVTQKSAGPSIRRCPVCQLPLERYHYLYTSSIVLHACTQCGGFFVEDGELGKMQEWLDQSHRPMSPEEEARVTLAEATIAHDDEIHRQHKFLHLFNVLQRYRPGWIGLMP